MAPPSLLGRIASRLAPYRGVIAGAVLVAGAVALAAHLAIGWRERTRHGAALDEIVALMHLPPKGSFHTTVDRVRTFVNDHSKHSIDAAFYAIWDRPHLMAEALAKSARDKAATKVSLECSRRSGLVADLLQRLGYTTRRLDIYDAEGLDSHTVLEVRNPVTSRWETVDPDYDIFWRDTATGLRTSVALAPRDPLLTEPCGRDGCGWHTKSREGLRAEKLGTYLDFVTVRSPDDRLRYTIYAPGADPAKVYRFRAKSGPYCDVLAKNCRDGFFALAAAPPT